MRRGEIDQQEATEARQTMERKANAEESDGDSSMPLQEENPWGEYEAEDALKRKKEELAQAGEDDITTESPIPVSTGTSRGRGRGRGRGQLKGWEVVTGSSKAKQSKRNRDSEEYDSEFTQSNGPRNKNKKQLMNMNSYNSNAFLDRNEASSISNPGASETGQSFALPRMPINNNSSLENSRKNSGPNSIATSNSSNSKASLPPSALFPASPGDLERQKRLEKAELMKRQFQERLQAKQQQQVDTSSGLANSNDISVAQSPKARIGSSEPSFRPPVSNTVNLNRRPGGFSAKPQSQPKSEWDEFLEDDVQRDRSESEDDLVFEQEQTSNWETL